MFHSKTQQNIFIGLGSNVGDRAGNLLLGLRGITAAGLEVVRLSAIYETEAVETIPQPAFLNMVAELKSLNALTSEQLMERLLRVEYALGRTRKTPRGPRNLDLDLLFFGTETSKSDFLTLPHPRLHKRRFVLVPLAEIAPDFVHPMLKKTAAELLEAVEDKAAVQRWKP